MNKIGLVDISSVAQVTQKSEQSMCTYTSCIYVDVIVTSVYTESRIWNDNTEITHYSSILPVLNRGRWVHT